MTWAAGSSSPAARPARIAVALPPSERAECRPLHRHLPPPRAMPSSRPWGCDAPWPGTDRRQYAAAPCCRCTRMADRTAADTGGRWGHRVWPRRPPGSPRCRAFRWGWWRGGHPPCCRSTPCCGSCRPPRSPPWPKRGPWRRWPHVPGGPGWSDRLADVGCRIWDRWWACGAHRGSGTRPAPAWHPCRSAWPHRSAGWRGCRAAAPPACEPALPPTPPAPAGRGSGSPPCRPAPGWAPAPPHPATAGRLQRATTWRWNARCHQSPDGPALRRRAWGRRPLSRDPGAPPAPAAESVPAPPRAARCSPPCAPAGCRRGSCWCHRASRPGYGPGPTPPAARTPCCPWACRGRGAPPAGWGRWWGSAAPVWFWGSRENRSPRPPATVPPGPGHRRWPHSRPVWWGAWWRWAGFWSWAWPPVATDPALWEGVPFATAWRRRHRRRARPAPADGRCTRWPHPHGRSRWNLPPSCGAWAVHRLWRGREWASRR